MRHSARIFSKEAELAAAEARIAELERLVGRLVLELASSNRADGLMAGIGASNTQR